MHQTISKACEIFVTIVITVTIALQSFKSGGNPQVAERLMQRTVNPSQVGSTPTLWTQEVRCFDEIEAVYYPPLRTTKEICFRIRTKKY